MSTGRWFRSGFRIFRSGTNVTSQQVSRHEGSLVRFREREGKMGHFRNSEETFIHPQNLRSPTRNFSIVNYRKIEINLKKGCLPFLSLRHYYTLRHYYHPSQFRMPNFHSVKICSSMRKIPVPFKS